MDPNKQVGLNNQQQVNTPSPQPVVNINKDTSEAEVSVHSTTAKKQVRGSDGKFVKKGEGEKLPPLVASLKSSGDGKNVNTGNSIPDLVNFKVTNPLVYIKAWWKKIMANEGIEFKMKAKPLTVFGVALIIFSLVFGVGGLVLPQFFPWMQFNNDLIAPTSTPEPIGEWKDTALKGTLKKTNSVPIKYFLLISSDEAVTLQAPSYISLEKLLDRRILATGQYNQKQKILIIQDAIDLEILSTSPQPIPTQTPSPVPTQTPTITPVPTIAPTIQPTQVPTQAPTDSPI